MDIHNGDSIDTLKNIIRLSYEDIKESYIDAFLMGYYDRTCEELDHRSYNRVTSLQTVLELFYKAGYILAHHDISLGSIHKNIAQMSEFREIAKNYLYRFNIKFFYEKNS